MNNAANDSIARGNIEADTYRQKVAGLIGTQRAAQAANGGVVDNDTNALLQQDTAQFGELDALTISNNAAREAYGYRVQANAANENAARTVQAGKNAFTSSLLGGVISGIGGMYSSGGLGNLFGSAQGAGTKAALSINQGVNTTGGAYA